MRSFVFAGASLLAFLVTCASTQSSAWRPAGEGLRTRWARDVSPERVWPEYPRPTMKRERWQNLNGLWNYAVVPTGSGEPREFAGSILVPFPIESSLSGVARRLEPGDELWYRRTFRVPDDWKAGRVLLHFGAVDWRARVILNGQQLGVHEGGYDGFDFDVTDSLKRGDNELRVAVMDPSDTGNQPRGKQVREPGGIWYTPSSGIWQTVWLEPVPKSYVAVDRGAIRSRASV
jgi:beta-galactosidase/beta-glucuronidase